MSLRAYRLATRMAAPALPFYLGWRARRGKEIAARLGERWGRTDATRPNSPFASGPLANSPLIWVHAASLGEATMMLEVIERIAARGASVLLTTQTVSAALSLAPRLPEGALHQFAPLDMPSAVERFLDHWRPDVALFAESELWPNLLLGLRARGIPAALVNARMNADSRARWERWPEDFARLIASFALILPGDAPTREALMRLTGRVLPEAVSLKRAVRLDPPDPGEVAALRATLGGPAIAVLSLHPEESAPLKTWLDAQGLRAVVVPRYPDRMEDYGLDGLTVLPGFGTTALACAAAQVALVGGSLLPSLRGHTPMEALHLGLPVASGPHVESFAGLYSDWYGTIGTRAEDALVRARQWMSDPGLRARDTRAAKRFAAAQTGVIDTVMDRLSPVLAPILDPLATPDSPL